MERNEFTAAFENWLRFTYRARLGPKAESYQANIVAEHCLERMAQMLTSHRDLWHAAEALGEIREAGGRYKYSGQSTVEAFRSLVGEDLGERVVPARDSGVHKARVLARIAKAVAKPPAPATTPPPAPKKVFVVRKVVRHVP